jgi:hypothetical protein
MFTIDRQSIDYRPFVGHNGRIGAVFQELFYVLAHMREKVKMASDPSTCPMTSAYAKIKMVIVFGCASARAIAFDQF